MSDNELDEEDASAPFSPSEVQYHETEATDSLKLYTDFLDAYPVTPHFFLSLSQVIDEAQDILDTWSTMELQLPRPLYRRILHAWENAIERLISLEAAGPPPILLLRPPMLRTVSNQLKLDIPKDILVMYVQLGFTIPKMADLLHVCVNTVARRIQEFGIKRKFAEISDSDLEQEIRRLKEHGAMGYVGTVSVMGHLRSIGIRIQRERIRRAMRAVDGEGVTDRRSHAAKRRRYAVAFINSLWHLDGYHKLIRWKIVIHGCIDGKSHMIVFLHASRSNRADTVTDYFIEAVRIFGTPSRVRGDFGGENLGVKELMEEWRGLGRGSFLQGKSTHNQRIERWWRDLRLLGAQALRDEFDAMEEEKLLDIDIPLHMWCLHLIWLPLINAILVRARNGWAHHVMSTEGGMSPAMLWEIGKIDAQRGGFTLNHQPAETPTADFSIYGSTHSRQRLRNDADPYVEIDVVKCPLPAAAVQELDEALCVEFGAYYKPTSPEFISTVSGRDQFCWAVRWCEAYLEVNPQPLERD